MAGISEQIAAKLNPIAVFVESDELLSAFLELGAVHRLTIAVGLVTSEIALSKLRWLSLAENESGRSMNGHFVFTS